MTETPTLIDYENSVFIHHHLGLGDHIVCNGMVRFISKTLKDKKLYVVVKQRNAESVFDMYRDNPQIEPYPVIDDDGFYKTNLEWDRLKLIRAGFEKCRRIDWAVSLYDSVNIPFLERWDSFYYKRDNVKEQSVIDALDLPSEFVLVHNVSSVEKFELKFTTNLPIVFVRPIKSCSMFAWLGVVEKAKEVHCIDSSFAHLVESFKRINNNLTFHDAKNDGVIFSKRQNWNFIKY